MIEYTYIKNIISIQKFHEYISNTFTIDGITYDEDTYSLKIHFETELSIGDKTSIDSLVEAYENPPKESEYINTCINTSIIKVGETEWVLACSWIEDGNKTLAKVKTICKLLPSTPDDSLQEGYEYYIRVLDVTNNTIIGEATLSNREYEQGVLPISWVPGGGRVLEFQVKKGLKGYRVAICNVTCSYMI